MFCYHETVGKRKCVCCYVQILSVTLFASFLLSNLSKVKPKDYHFYDQ